MGRKEEEKEKEEEGGVKQLALRLPEELHRNLKLKCVKIGRTMGDVLIELIQEYLKRKD